jgi:hypothetical protein
MSSIPTTTSVSESAVIAAPFSSVWHLIKLQSFSSFWSKLEKSEYVSEASGETDIVKWTFKDGTVLDVKQEEHSSIGTSTIQIRNPQLRRRYISCISGDRMRLIEFIC